MNHIPADTYWVRLSMAGSIEDAKRIIRRDVYPPAGGKGLCVTIEPTTFIYSGGEESGFAVGFVNYPRFPANSDAIWERAKTMAELLIVELCQWSALLVAPDKTLWIHNRPEGM